MNRHAQLFALAAREAMPPTRFARLVQFVLPHPSDDASETGLRRGLHGFAVLALLVAIGLALAAAWPVLALPLQLALAEGAFAVCLALAWLRTRWRTAALAVAFVLQGVLLFVFGRVLDAVPGTDWPLCLIWALLALPLVLATRGAALWLAWTLLAQFAIALWLGERMTAGLTWGGGVAWGPAMIAWLASFALTALLGRLERRHRRLGPRRHWVFHLSAWCSIGLVTVTALITLLATGPQPTYVLGIAAVVGCWVVLERTGAGRLDLIGLCAAALDLLLLCWLVLGLIERIEDLGTLLMLGCFAAIVIALSAYLAHGSQHRARRRRTRA